MLQNNKPVVYLVVVDRLVGRLDLGCRLGLYWLAVVAFEGLALRLLATMVVLDPSYLVYPLGDRGRLAVASDLSTLDLVVVALPVDLLDSLVDHRL